MLYSVVKIVQSHMVIFFQSDGTSFSKQRCLLQFIRIYFIKFYQFVFLKLNEEEESMGVRAEAVWCLAEQQEGRMS